MFATVSLLDDASHARVQDLWRLLETRCDLVGIRSFPIPHFTYQSAARYDLDGLKPALRRAAVESRPFLLSAVGLGIFPAPSPVLYLSLVKTPELLAFQRRIWDTLLPFSIQPNPLYAPGAWTPHISLALADLTNERLSCALRQLAFAPIAFEVRVNILAVVCQEGSKVGRMQLGYTFEHGNLF
jgi:hypothetical protein